MAYKFQLGEFNTSGSVVIKTDLDAEAGDIDAQNITGSTLTVAGASPTVTVSGVTKIDKATGTNGIVLNMTNDAGGEQAMLHEFNGGGGNPNIGAALQLGVGSNTAQFTIRNRSDNAASNWGLEMRDASAALQVKANWGGSGEGAFSGSGNSTFGAASTVGRDLYVTGAITHTGADISFDADVEVWDSIAVDSAESTAASVTGSFIFGSGAGAHGARLKFHSGSTEGLHVVIRNGNDTAGVAGQASLVGDGSALTGLGAGGNLNFAPVNKDASASNDDKVLVPKKINVITTLHGTAGQSEILLPSTASLVAGDIISVKLNVSSNGPVSTTDYIDFERSGSDACSIDGNSTAPLLRVTSPKASFDLVYKGTGAFAIV
tara:strand:+ start:1833 stop:2960 length:1128 start_codon:yes stop_codon:yes gene_type:complete